ncbi:hypothetical protein ACEPAG_8824 [Sanghuangporus baumii]
MLFSRIVSFFAFTATLGGVALAKPLVEKRDEASVQAVVTDLKSTVDTILPQISNLTANNQATEQTVIPLMDQLIQAFGNATTSLVGLSTRSVPGDLEKRQSVFNVAQLISDIMGNVATTVGGVVNGPAASSIPSLGNRLSLLDSTSSGLLSGLDSLLPGVLGIVTGLLGTLLPTVLGLLSSGGGSGLGGLLGILGILGL